MLDRLIQYQQVIKETLAWYDGDAGASELETLIEKMREIL